jgi:hydroxymethylglutaryl-CoA lyase
LPDAVVIRDVCPRDGLQSESPVAAVVRAELAVALADAGVPEVEAASFVSPSAVPSMADAAAVVADLPHRPDVRWWALVPNRKGAELARNAGVTALTVTVSASPAYSVKNVGMDVETSLTRLADVVGAGAGALLDVVVSCAFGSPFDDVSGPAAVVHVVDAVRALGLDRFTLADTAGTGTPRRVAVVLDALDLGDDVDVGLHLHDTRGTALANALRAVELGIRRFDTAAGGLGGSPFAPGAGGNLATEDLVLVLDDLGVGTGIDLDAILRISAGLPAVVGHPVPSRTANAGRLPAFAGPAGPAPAGP